MNRPSIEILKHHSFVNQHFFDNFGGNIQGDLFKVHQVGVFELDGKQHFVAFDKDGKSRSATDLQGMNHKNGNQLTPNHYEQLKNNGTKRERKYARKQVAKAQAENISRKKLIQKEVTKTVMKFGGLEALDSNSRMILRNRFDINDDEIEKLVNEYKTGRAKEQAKQKKIDEIKARHSGKPSVPDVVKDFETKPKKSPKVNGGKPIKPPAGFKLDEFLGAFPNYRVFEESHKLEQQAKKGGSPAEGPPKPPEPPKGGEPKTRGSVSGNQYRRAQKGLQKAEMNAGKEALMGVRSRISKMSGKSRLGTLAALGLKLGVTHSMLDNDDDTVMSTLITSSVYAGGITGAVFAGKKYLDGVDEAQKKSKLYTEQSKRFEDAADGDQKKIDELKKTHGEEKGEEIRKRKNLETKEERLKRTLSTDGKGPLSHEDRVVKRGKQMMKAGKIGMGVIAVGGVLSALHGMKRNGDVEDIKDDGEKKIRLEKREQKQKNRDYGYNNPTMGNIAFEMFEQRTGHYKMGDSRFQ